MYPPRDIISNLFLEDLERIWEIKKIQRESKHSITFIVDNHIGKVPEMEVTHY